MSRKKKKKPEQNVRDPILRETLRRRRRGLNAYDYTKEVPLGKALSRKQAKLEVNGTLSAELRYKQNSAPTYAVNRSVGLPSKSNDDELIKKLRSFQFPTSGEFIQPGLNALGYPSDIPPGLIAALLNEYATVGNRSVYIFPGSNVPKLVGGLLNKELIQVDILDDSCSGMHDVNVEFGYPVPARVCDEDDLRRDKKEPTQLLIVRAPQPGFEDRLADFSYSLDCMPGGPDPKKVLYWARPDLECIDGCSPSLIIPERLSFEEYFDYMKWMLEPWVATLHHRQGRVALISGFGRWSKQGGQPRELFPRLVQIIQSMGLALERVHPMLIQPLPGPRSHRANEYAWLHVFGQRVNQ